MARTVSASSGDQESEILVSGSDDPLVIADAAALFQGTYMRQLSDLVIEAPDGALIRVTDYFVNDATPDLYSEQGAVLTADIVNRLVGAQNPMVFAQAGNGSGQTPIGQVETLEGTAFATRANGQRVALQVGDPVFEDDLVETGGSSSLGLTFIDETVFSLSANARMVLDELIYQDGGANNSMVMNLVQGTFVFITGKVAPTGDMQVETPVATVGIRGTTPIMVIDGQNGSTQFGLFQDPDGDIGAYTIFDKITGAIIRQVVSTSTTLQLDRIGGDPLDVTVDAALLAERADAQSNAYFLYAASRSRIDSRQNDNNQDGGPDGGPGAGPGDRSDLGPGGDDLDAANRLSSGLNPRPVGFTESPPGEPSNRSQGDPNRPDLPIDMVRGSGFDPLGDGNFPPIADNLLFQFSEDTKLAQGALSALDPDGPTENLTFEITRQPQFGAIVANDDGSFSYVPDPIFNVLKPGEVSEVSFDYRAIDDAGARSNNATVILQILGINDAPIAKDDGSSGEYEVAASASVNILVSELLANDKDPDGDTFDITNVFNPDNGSVVLNPGAGASVTFSADYGLTDGTVVGFDYTITDVHGASSVASVEIIIDNM